MSTLAAANLGLNIAQTIQLARLSGQIGAMGERQMQADMAAARQNHCIAHLHEARNLLRDLERDGGHAFLHVYTGQICLMGLQLNGVEPASFSGLAEKDACSETIRRCEALVRENAPHLTEEDQALARGAARHDLAEVFLNALMAVMDARAVAGRNPLLFCESVSMAVKVVSSFFFPPALLLWVAGGALNGGTRGKVRHLLSPFGLSSTPGRTAQDLAALKDDLTTMLARIGAVPQNATRDDVAHALAEGKATVAKAHERARHYAQNATAQSA